MNILITGITGFVGSHLSEFLLKQNSNDKVFGTYFNEKELANISDVRNQIELYKCDIAAKDQINEVARKSMPDYVYHLAGASSGAEEDRKKVFSVNVDGTVNLLESLKKTSKNIKILLASTGYVYGNADDKSPLTEKSEVKPMGIYAESKLEMEKQAKNFRKSNLAIFITRAFNHTGPRQSPDFVVPAFAKQIAEIEKKIKKPFLHVGNLEAVRDFLDVRDVIAAYHVIMTQAKSGNIYNIASGRGVKIKDVLEKLLTLASVEIKIRKDVNRLRPADISYSVGSFMKINEEFGWQPKISFKETLKSTLNFWRKNI